MNTKKRRIGGRGKIYGRAINFYLTPELEHEVDQVARFFDGDTSRAARFMLEASSKTAEVSRLLAADSQE